MFNRYSITKTAETICQQYQCDKNDDLFSLHYNACPTQDLPVIPMSTTPVLQKMCWGIPLDFSKNKPVSERFLGIDKHKILQTPRLFKRVLSHRILVPMDGYYIWKIVAKKRRIAYRFSFPNNTIFSVPGIWEPYTDDKQGNISTFKLITTESTDNSQSFPQKAPFILGQEAIKAWLNPVTSTNDLELILESLSQDVSNKYPVSGHIERLNFNSPDAIKKTPLMDNFGVYNLFD